MLKYFRSTALFIHEEGSSLLSGAISGDIRELYSVHGNQFTETMGLARKEKSHCDSSMITIALTYEQTHNSTKVLIAKIN